MSSRLAATYPEVCQAIEKIMANGEQPTISRIREELGDRGSVTVIGKYLKQWLAKAQEQMPFTIDASALETENPLPLSTRSAAPEENLSVPLTPTEPTEPKIAPSESSNKYMEEFSRAPKVVSFDTPYPEVPESVQALLDKKQSDPAETWARAEDLESCSKDTLIAKLRRLESFVQKEQTRREVAEKTAREARAYAESIKNMVAERINYVRQTMQEAKDRCALDYEQYKTKNEKELIRYREQLDIANKKLAENL